MSRSWHWGRFSVPKKGHKYHSNGPENRLKPQRCTQISCADFFGCPLSCLNVYCVTGFCFHHFFSVLTILACHHLRHPCFPVSPKSTKCTFFILQKIHASLDVYESFCIFLYGLQVFCLQKKTWFPVVIQFSEADLGASSLLGCQERSNFPQTCLQSTSSLFAKNTNTKKMNFIYL